MCKAVSSFWEDVIRHPLILTAHAWLRERPARRSVVRCVPRTQRITDQRKEPKMSARPCDQLCPITADRM
ncbi:unnamed protein product [Staurois parvus]|uniref:Uncharacterized protein n=1 Tax=Staurois parvus TaxID=386267 RepID=A0ABN9BN74_9NEOB|nr:unnamed protein product [Staurois parvus]